MAAGKVSATHTMFIYYVLTVSHFVIGAPGFEMLKLLLGEDLSFRTDMSGGEVSNEDRIIQLLSEIPFTMSVKTVAWFNLLRYRSAECLHLADWKSYEPLIPFLPIPMLQAVNFSDDHILSYFGTLKLDQIQLSQVAQQVKLKNANVLQNETLILKLGSIFCGFSPKELFQLDTSLLRSLLEKNFFQKIKSCSIEQLRVLSKIMSQYTIMGPPRTWQPERVRQAGSLVAGLEMAQLKEIRARSFSEISSDVIPLIPVEFLKELKNSQLRSLNQSALMTWRRQTKDLREIHENEAATYSVQISMLTLTCICVLLN